MSSEPSSSRNVIDNIQNQVLDDNKKLDPPPNSNNADVIRSQEPESLPSTHSEVTNPEGRKNTRFAPVRRATQVSFDLSQNDPQPSQQPANSWHSQNAQYMSSPQSYSNARIFSSPENMQASLGPQSPWTVPTNLNPEPLYTSGPYQQTRSHSLPGPPSRAIEPIPQFYTPQAQRVPLTSPGHMSYQLPAHSHQSAPHQGPQSWSTPIVPNLHSQMQGPSHYADAHTIPTTRREKILTEVADSFVANDPFDFHAGLDEEEDLITFDDIELSPIPEDSAQRWVPSQDPWAQLQGYQNPFPQSWTPPQTPWPSSAPSSWGQIYSPFTEPTPYDTHPPVEAIPTSTSASNTSARPSGWTSSNTEPETPLTSPDQEDANEASIYLPTPQSTPIETLNPEKPQSQQQTADESTTNAPIPEIVPGALFPEGGEIQHSPVGSPRQSPPKMPEIFPVGEPVGSMEGSVPSVVNEYPPAPIFQSYVTVDPSPYGPYTTLMPNDLPNIGTNVYPYYFQIQNGQMRKPLRASMIPERTSFWTSLKDFFRWLFSRRICQSIPEMGLPYYMSRPPIPAPKRSNQFTDVTMQLLTTTVPRQVYLHVLLRLPSLYFSRVARIFEEADLTLREIKKMALETGLTHKGQVDISTFETTKDDTPEYTKLKSTWEAFIDSVMREWKTFNIISVLLLSAILTILQIQSAAQNAITRYTALASLICSLISLLFGCTYIIRFGTMRKPYKAAEWALEARQKRTTVWWNVWVLLAMPAIWLTWSIIMYTICIMSFVWQSSAATDQNPPNPISAKALLAVRIVMTSLLGLGIVYGMLILSTFRRYGQVMDNTWKRRINRWVEEKRFRSRSFHALSPGFQPWPQSYQNPFYQGGSSTNFPPLSTPAPPGSPPFGVYGQRTPYQDFPPLPTFANSRQFQFPNATPDVPSPSSISSELWYSGPGYFSKPKGLELFIEEQPSSFVPPNEGGDAYRSENVNENDASPPSPVNLSGEQSGYAAETTSSAAPFRSNHNPSEPQLDPGQSSLPLTSRASSSMAAIYIHGMKPPEDQDDGPEPSNDQAGPGGRSSERHGLRTVRFRSPLVSPEVTQFEESVSGRYDETMESVLSGLPDDSLSTTASPSTPDGPGPTDSESSTNVPRSTS